VHSGLGEPALDGFSGIVDPLWNLDRNERKGEPAWWPGPARRALACQIRATKQEVAHPLGRLECGQSFGMRCGLPPTRGEMRQRNAFSIFQSSALNRARRKPRPEDHETRICGSLTSGRQQNFPSASSRGKGRGLSKTRRGLYARDRDKWARAVQAIITSQSRIVLPEGGTDPNMVRAKPCSRHGTERVMREWSRGCAPAIR
jgi:hypothetical protein